MLGWLEIKQRYRRPVLGPFWLTISTGVMVAAMGPLYGKLFGQPAPVYFSYLAISVVVWMFISGLINDACNTFILAEGYIKQMKLPLTVDVMLLNQAKILVFASNDEGLIRANCNKIMRLDHGRIVSFGDLEPPSMNQIRPAG